MIRDDICGSLDRPSPPQKRTPWLLILLVFVAGLGAAHVAGLTGPLASIAAQFVWGGGRDMGTPSGRLVGEWASNDDPMFRHICHPAHKKSWSGTGLYMTDGAPGMNGVIYRLESEDRSGTNLVMAEFMPGPGLNLRVRYTVAEDGKSMTREYDHDGKHVLSRYRYVGAPTQSMPGLSP